MQSTVESAADQANDAVVNVLGHGAADDFEKKTVQEMKALIKLKDPTFNGRNKAVLLDKLARLAGVLGRKSQWSLINYWFSSDAVELDKSPPEC